MKKVITLASSLLALSIAFCAHDATATEYQSLFFSQKQLTQIHNDVARRSELFAIPEKYRLTLESIFYYSEDNWMVRLQGRQWTPSTSDPLMSIHKVTSQSVTLSVTLASGLYIENLTLHPRQTLNLLTGEILNSPIINDVE